MYRLGSVEEHDESRHTTAMDITDLRKVFAEPYSSPTLDVPHNIRSAQQSAYSPLTMEPVHVGIYPGGFPTVSKKVFYPWNALSSPLRRHDEGKPHERSEGLSASDCSDYD
jgi:hypothetical protein